ncbi:cupin [Natrarchaeobius chitinivorans]|uniref:Cupin n=1 Tax=Natrarchaeobius chitinivorans TaxID=1679083 RepID=A0A3N6PCD9_NATCH|nr:cupin [Natrarchaeobius chitinivorans]RQG94425.1 cupin [Natrarchaeobius chitinivorans]
MERVSIDDLEAEPVDPDVHTDRRDVAEPLNADHVAITRYVLEPGERFSASIHAHVDQEEVFLVLEGEATFAVRSGADGSEGADSDRRELVVGDNEAIRFAPGEFQSGWNDAEERLVALALGAPRETDEIRISSVPTLEDGDVECPDCGRGDMRVSPDDTFECPDCGAVLDLE